MLYKCPLVLGRVMAFAIAAATFMSSPAAQAATDPPVVAASSATVATEHAIVAKTVTGNANVDLAIAVVAVLATVGFIVWRNRFWNRRGNPSGSPGRANKSPLEPYPRE